MSSASSLHIIQSSEAAARLREAERWLTARANRGALSSRRRAAPPTISARRSRCRAGRRPASTASASRSSRRASRRRSSRRAASRRPRSSARKPSPRARRSTRGRDEELDRTSAPWPARPDSRARWRGRCTISRWRASSRRRCASCRSAGPTSRACSRASTSSSPPPPRPVAPRSSRPPARASPPLPACRSSCSTCRSSRRSSSRSREHLIAAAPETFDHRSLRRSRDARLSRDARRPDRDARAVGRFGSRGAATLALRDAAAARTRSRAATCGSSRRPARAASASRSPGGSSTKRERGVRFDEMAVFLRSPREYLGLLENAFERAGINAWFDRGARRPHPSGRAFLAILELRGRASVGGPLCRVPLARAGARTRDATPAAEVLPPADDVDRRIRRRRDRARRARHREPPAPPDDDDEHGHRRRRPARAVEVGAPDRRGLGRRRRSRALAAAAARPARGLRRADQGRAAARGSRVAEAGRPRARSPEPGAPLGLRAADRRDARVMARAGDVGRVARAVRRAGAARAAPAGARAARARRAARDERHRSGRARGSARRARRAPAHVRRAAAGRSLRPRVRRQPAPGARPRVQGRVRPGTGRAAVSAEAARGSAAARRGDARSRSTPALGTHLVVQDDRAKTERLLLRLAVGAATDRLWLSYPRLDVGGARPRVPSFYVLDVMRAIIGHDPAPRGAAARSGGWPAARSSTGRRRPIRRTRSTKSSTIWRRFGCSSTRPIARPSAATRTTCSASTRRSAAR